MSPTRDDGQRSGRHVLVPDRDKQKEFSFVNQEPGNKSFLSKKHVAQGFSDPCL